MLGTVRVVRDDRIVSHFRTRKAAHLLACLALPPGRSRQREALADLFWPDLETDAGRDNLSTALAFLRKVLEPNGVPAGAVLVSDRQNVRLNEVAVTTDLMELEDVLGRAEQERDPRRRTSLLERADELYAGDLVADCYDDWLAPEQRRWSERRIDTLLRLAQALEETGNLERALDGATRACDADPLREDACALRIRLLAAVGRLADAHRFYSDYERRLEAEIGAPPPPSLRALVEEMRPGRSVSVTAPDRRMDLPAEPDGAAALRPVASVAGARFRPLPAAFGRLHGREREMERLLGLLAPASTPDGVPTEGARLVTVTGTGGAGKTRLAIEAARRLLPAYAGRVAFVELESLDDPGRVPSALLKALRVYSSPEADPFECAANALGGRPALLVLDNYEQLLTDGDPSDGRAVLREMLSTMTQCRCLVTSRRALCVEGEQELALAPLATPSQAGLDCDSVSLFVDRVRAIDPAFEITERNEAEVCALCERLEGLPLAIEMAASWTRVLPTRAVRERLEREPIGLVSRRADAPARHMSLQATLQWSYELLTDGLRRAFGALSVFRGGWTLEAAEAVIGDGAAQALADLAERSLVVVDGDGARCGYLETVRVFAAERLREGDASPALRSHARFYVGLAQRSASQVSSVEPNDWSVLAREFANVNAALEWLSSTGQHRELARAVLALERFWSEEGHRFNDGFAWTDLATSSHIEPDAIRAGLLMAGGRLHAVRGGHDEAKNRFDESRAISAALGDVRAASAAAMSLARVHAQTGEETEARRLAAGAVDTVRALGDPGALAWSLCDLAGVALRLGDAAEHERVLNELAVQARSADLPQQLAHALYGLGMFARDRGDLEAARQLWEECAAVDEQLGIRGGGALWGLGLVAERRGDGADAARWYGRSLFENLAEGRHPRVADGFVTLATRAAERGQTELSARLIGAALRQWDDADYAFVPERRDWFEAHTGALRERLGPEQCEALMQEGWRMDPAAAIELALEDVRAAGVLDS